MHGIAGPTDLTWRIGLLAILHFIWPLALLYVVLRVPYWIILSLYQPDLIIWLEVSGCSGVPQGSTPGRAGLAAVLAKPLRFC